VVEQSGAIGEGTIGRWCINSDSTGFTFADCLTGPPGSELAPLRNHPLTREFLAGETALCRCSALVSFGLGGGGDERGDRGLAKRPCSPEAQSSFDTTHENGLAHAR